MKAQFDVLTFAVLGLLSFAQADTYHYYDAPAKRGILGDILGKLNGGDKGGAATKTAVSLKTAAAKTVTETLRQTITVGAAAAAGLNQTAAAVKTETMTLTVTQSAAAQKQGNQTVANGAAGQFSFVTTTVFAEGAAPTVTITDLASTVTQQVTMTMVQMIACGTTQGAPVPASEAGAIATSAAAAAAAPASTQINSVFTSGAAQLASTAVVIGSTAVAAIPTSTLTTAAIQATTPLPAASSSIVLPANGNNPVAVAPAVAVTTMNPANIQGVNQGPTVDLSNVSLNSVINLGALVQQPTAGAVL